MKTRYRIVGAVLAVFLLLGAVPATVWADFAGGLSSGKGGVSPSDLIEKIYNADYTDVTSLYDVSALFRAHYNPDLVSANKLEADKTYTLVVQLDGFSLTQYWELEGKNGKLSDYITSEAGQRHAKEIADDIAASLAELDATGTEYRHVWTYDTVLKAYAVEIKGADANRVSGLPSVVAATVSERYGEPKVEEIENNVNVYSTGIYNTSGIDPSMRGEGTLVAVLDTGLDYTHAAFSGETFLTDPAKVVLTKEKVAKLLDEQNFRAETLSQGLSVDDIYVSLKVPYAYDYADDDADVFPSYSYHGAHVAGIIAGNYTKIPAGSRWLDDEDLVFVEEKDADGNPTGDYYFEGVAPYAQLAIMKVFTDNVEADQLGGADTEDILMALDDCAKLGVDVINMSLGSSAGFSSYADTLETIVMSQVYTAVYTAGISLVCAASNDYSSGYGGVNGTNLTSNPDSATVGAPSTYPAAISVASIDGRKSPYLLGNKGSGKETMVFFTESNDGNRNKRDFMKQMFAKSGKDIASDTLDMNYIVIGGVGRSYNYSMVTSKLDALHAEGKCVAALVVRGTTSFEEKMQCAMDAGFDCIIIRNNVAGGISMSMGKTDEEEMIPAISISLDVGQELLDNATDSVGTLELNTSYAAGPFMSDFSSWGPTPSLRLKPEITSYGGNVTSAVTGGYDVYSGTSMATPNLAGACAIIRTYLHRMYPDYNQNQLAALTYQLLMSTAKIALNEAGDPYSPRKQGAGIADIESVLSCVAYLWTKNEDGSMADRPKLELGDDPDRKGVYEMTYYLTNTAETAVSYLLGEYVMTERVSSDGKTVAERAHLFEDYGVRYEIANADDNSDHAWRAGQKRLTVESGSTVEIRVTVTLSNADKAYLDEHFENGMYVEGFLTLTADGEPAVDLSIPFLAFYGDWTDSPMLDLSVFELSKIEQDDSIPDDEKEKISFFATAPYAKYGEKYIIPLGQYVYTEDETAAKVYPDTEHAAISMYNETDGHYTTYTFYAVYAGLLRGAKVLEYRITDARTGKVVCEKELRNVAKGYAAGGSTRPGYVEIEFTPYELGLPNNSKYVFEMVGYLDYGDGKQGNKNSFSFEFYTDYESPVLSDLDVRYVTQKENDKDVTHIYLDAYTYDNHYTQALLLCYRDDENVLQLATEYVTPVYSTSRGAITKTTIEITDIYEKYFDRLYLQVEDFAMNYTVFELDLEKNMVFPTGFDFEEDEITLDQNEAYKPAYSFTPDDAQNYDLTWKSMNESIAIVKDGEIYGVGEGSTYVYVYASKGATVNVPRARIRVNVTAEKAAERVPFKAIRFDLISDRKSRPLNPTGAAVEVRPNYDYQLKIVKDPWYAADAEIKWSSSNPLVATVDENGLVHTLRRGSTTITAESGVCSASVRLTVSEEYIINNFILTDYYGEGGDVVVPEKYNFMYIDEEAFMDNDSITSIVIPDGVTEIYKDAFKNCRNLRKIVLPDTLTYIHESAFEGCTALEEIDMSRCLSVIVGKRCFYGCRSLKTITTDERGCRIVAAWDYAFAGCRSLESYDAQNLCIVGDYVFSDCSSLESINLTGYTTIGKGMFYNCSALTELTLPSQNIGENAFGGCSGLDTVTFTSPLTVIGAGAFSECTNLTTVNFNNGILHIGDRAFSGCRSLTYLDLPDGELTLGERAFSGCTKLLTLRFVQNTKISLTGSAPFENCGNFRQLTAMRLKADGTRTPVANGKTALYQIRDNVLYSLDGTKLLLIPTGLTVDGHYRFPEGVTAIGDNAFWGHDELKTIDLSGIKEIGMYAFESSGLTTLSVPASVTVVGEGAFNTCHELKTATFDAASPLTELPARLFENSGSLSEVRLPGGLRSVGAYAFADTGLRLLTAAGESGTVGLLDGMVFGNLAQIGHMAFAGTFLTTVELPNTLKFVGNAAFGYCTGLEQVIFANGVEDLTLGEGLFYDSMALRSVILPEGLTALGIYTFAGKTDRMELSEVVLPTTLETIGAYAFYGCAGLKSLNLAATKVTVLPEYALYGCTGLEEIDLTKIRTFGTAAFAFNKAMKQIDLAGATVIGDRAFYGVGAEEVLIPVAQVVGLEAFMESNLRRVTLPATLTTLGQGALSYNFYLTEIRMPERAENYFVDPLTDGDGNKLEYGVLYSVLPNGGYQVECFPGGLKYDSYAVLEGTVRIGTEAFEGVLGLNAVHLPASLETIGPKAFYDTYLKVFFFNSVKAPELECDYVDAEDGNVTQDDWIYKVFSRDGGQGLEQYYANFFYYSAYAAYTGLDFGLSLNYPINGYGYDSPIWTDFFGQGMYIDEVPDEQTLAAVKAIKALKTPDEVRLMNEADFRAYLETVKNARTVFNTVSAGKQTEYISGDYDGTDYRAMLLSVETVVREKRAAFGMGNPVARLRVAEEPTRTVYTERDALDATGMKVKVIYEDGSEETVDTVTLKTKIATSGTKYITVTVLGKEVSTPITVKPGQFALPAEPATEEIITEITQLLSPSEIALLSGDSLTDYAKEVSGLRAKVDALADNAQYALLTGEYNGTDFTAQLSEVEAALRKKTVPAVTSIRVITAPAKTVYTVGETISTDGLLVVAVYADGSHETISGYTLSAEKAESGMTGITVTYQGMTAEFAVTVLEATVAPTKSTLTVLWIVLIAAGGGLTVAAIVCGSVSGAKTRKMRKKA